MMYSVTHRNDLFFLVLDFRCLLIVDYIWIKIFLSIRFSRYTVQETDLILEQVGLSGLEPPTSRLSGVRSNRLSYKPE